MDLDGIKHIHIIAICGTAMGALAGMLKQRGFRVTGSDQGVYPPMSDHLKALGIEIMEGFRPENLDVAPDLVIVGNTVKKINPEAEELIRRGIPYMHLPSAIREFFLKDRHPVVIGGTHGKTTTTSLCSWVLESAGYSPGFLIGGIHKNFNTNSRAAEGSFFVIEGDEYDSAYFDKVPKFWHYRPETAVITSVEFDHGDIYRDIEHVKEAFKKFASLLPVDGYLIACSDYPDVTEVVKDAPCRVVTYGYGPKADAVIENLVLSEKGSHFDLAIKNRGKYHFETNLWGGHNALNAAAVALVCLHHGLTPRQIQKGFDTFQGIKRRQEIFYDKNGVIIIDDFAHHPTKVRETVKAVRARFINKRLISVYEPRTNTSRRNFFQNTYPDSFTGSDMVVIAGVFNPAQIEPESALDVLKLVEDIRSRGIDAYYQENAREIIDFLGDETKEGDVVLIMSNGGFDGIYKKLEMKIDEIFAGQPV